MNIDIPAPAAVVLDRLEQHGYEGYVVGGCVRDAMLGRAAKDWDVCTNAAPEQMLACFEGLRTIPTGLAHGTVTVLVQREPVEVTTYRVDGAYSDHRHPDSVCFTASLREDLARRDFTVNAMAYHPKTELVDLFDGKADLAKRVIRCVGDPVCRFEEDALRILRGLRFASVLDFSVDPATAAAMAERCHLLDQIARERVFSEVTQLLCGPAADGVLRDFWPVLARVLPFGEELTPPGVLTCLPPEPALRYAALYRGHNRVLDALVRLRAPKRLAERGALLSRAAMLPVPATLAETRRLAGNLGEEAAAQTLTLMKAFGANTGQAEVWYRQIRSQRLCCRVADLAVSGDHLSALGIHGPQTGQILNRLLEAVICEEIPNEQTALLDRAKAIAE